MIKKVMVSLMLSTAIAASVQAKDVKETNRVWLPYTGGVLEQSCRTVWKEYDSIFGATTIITPMVGANTMLAVNDMIDNREQNKFMCAASSMSIYNQLINKNTDFKGDQFETIIQTAEDPAMWYVPKSNTADATLQAQIEYWKKLGRPINVGSFTGIHDTIVHYLEKKYGLKVNLIPYKTAPQLYPSLADGTLDLAFDSGLGQFQAKTAGFRTLGYSSPYNFPTLKEYRNFGQDDPALEQIKGWFSIQVLKNADPEWKKRMAARLKFVVEQPKFREHALANGSHVLGRTGKELQENIAKQKAAVEQYYK